MERNNKNFEYTIYQSASEMPEEYVSLMQRAINQLEFAYAPYSQFLVGAALILDNGEVFVGNNQENASFPLCMCAERVALYSLGAAHQSFQIKALAITAKNLKKEHKGFCMPCGACRQVIQEFEQRQETPITLLLSGDDDQVMQIKGIDKILPLSFSSKDLL